MNFIGLRLSYFMEKDEGAVKSERVGTAEVMLTWTKTAVSRDCVEVVFTYSYPIIERSEDNVMSGFPV